MTEIIGKPGEFSSKYDKGINGNELAPAGIKPDFDKYVHTFCEGKTKRYVRWSTPTFTAYIGASGGTRCVMKSTGMVARESSGYVEIIVRGK